MDDHLSIHIFSDAFGKTDDTYGLISLANPGANIKGKCYEDLRFAPKRGHPIGLKIACLTQTVYQVVLPVAIIQDH